jgi:predicted GTPase
MLFRLTMALESLSVQDEKYPLKKFGGRDFGANLQTLDNIVLWLGAAGSNAKTLAEQFINQQEVNQQELIKQITAIKVQLKQIADKLPEPPVEPPAP